jgi:chromosomal replication initiation ATPase DnaA
MAFGYLDLAYLIEISVVFNLAYREIKHGTVLEQMNKIRDKMSRDKEFQERIKKR